MRWRRRNRHTSASLDEADHAIAQAERDAEQAAETRQAAEARRDAERRWFFTRLVAAGDADYIAATIERSLREGRP